VPVGFPWDGATAFEPLPIVADRHAEAALGQVRELGTEAFPPHTPLTAGRDVAQACATSSSVIMRSSGLMGNGETCSAGNGQGCPRIHNGCPPLVGGGVMRRFLPKNTLVCRRAL